MLIPMRKTVTTVAKRVFKAVTCERCGCKYGYHISATGSVWGSRSTLGIADDHLDKVDRERAFASVYRSLNSMTRLVACPKCGWYQEKMVIGARNRYKGWMSSAGIFSLSISGVLLAFMLLLDAADGAWIKYGSL